MKLPLAKIKNTVLSFIILSLTFFIGWVISTSAAPRAPTVTSKTEKLNIHFIDIGNGDSILLDLGETEILIDGGFAKPGVVTGIPKMLTTYTPGTAAYIKDYIDGPLDVMVATHVHGDHIGGLIEVLESFDVSEIWLNGDTFPLVPHPFSIYYKEFSRSVKAEGATIHVARRGQTMDIGILSLSVLHPDILLPPTPGNMAENQDNNSIVLKLRYGNIAFLFTGDVRKQAEESILKAGLDIHADILKVCRHGAITSSSPQFLNAISPKVAVWMAGIPPASAPEKKPDPITISALKNVGAKVYGTRTHGTVIITTNGETYTINTEK